MKAKLEGDKEEYLVESSEYIFSSITIDGKELTVEARNGKVTIRVPKDLQVEVIRY